jgi:hypothetical protein
MIDGLGVRQDRKPDIVSLESLTESSQMPFDPGNRIGMNAIVQWRHRAFPRRYGHCHCPTAVQSHSVRAAPKCGRRVAIIIPNDLAGNASRRRRPRYSPAIARVDRKQHTDDLAAAAGEFEMLRSMEAEARR